MATYLMVLDHSANRVYREALPRLAKAELEITVPSVDDVEITEIGKASALRFRAHNLDLEAIAGQSCFLILFAEQDSHLIPLTAQTRRFADDDLLTIPKYQGKTNEALTRLLVHLAACAAQRPRGHRLAILDPMCGRATTLLAGWIAGMDGYGVEADTKTFEALAAFVKTYLRTKCLKHTASVNPVRRDGKTLGKRLDVDAYLLGKGNEDGHLAMSVITGDTRQSAQLFGKKRFDLIVTDAPYGVYHGAAHRADDRRDRSPAQLLTEAIPVWAGQLARGGAIGIAWNTTTMPRPQLAELLTEAGLEVMDGPAWESFSHRVDAAITRDLIVARGSVD